LVEFAEEDWESPAFGGKRCFNSNKKVLEATANKGKGKVPWHTDGLTPELNSMSVIINWLMTDGNYSRWQGTDKQNGTTKVGIANELSQLIKDKGITVERPGRDIHVRINRLEQQFRAAKDWLNQASKGVTCEESIKAAVIHRCPYHYVLEDVMRDHASSMPLSTMSSISNLKILDDDGRAGELDDNKPIEVDTPTFKRVVGDLPTLKKNPRTSPSSLSLT